MGYTSKKNQDKGTIIIGRVGAYCGSVYFENQPVWVSDNALSANPKLENNPKFFYYFLKNLNLNQVAQGSSHPLLTQTLLHSLDVLVCQDKKQQKTIAEVLSSLDDKIELLHQQNKTLEDLAKTLFRKYFIEEAQPHWQEGKLGDFLETIESGSRPKGGIDSNLKEGIPSIGAESINGIGNFDFSKIKYISHDFFKNMKKGIIKDYDILIYKDGAYIGKKALFGQGFPFKNMSVNEHVFILRANNKTNQFFLYFLLNQNELSKLNTNSAQPGLNQQAMKSFKILIPPKNKMSYFEKTVKPWVDKILFNSNQIKNLEKLRNTLLPKLMNGKVKLKCLN